MQERYRRMSLAAALMLVRSGDAWTADLINISASGALISTPDNWLGRVGDEFVVDLPNDNGAHIHLRAKVARQDEHSVGLAFTHIPSETEIPLWELLGEFADAKEQA